MNPTASGSLAVLGRLFIVTIFLASAIGNKILNFSGAVDYTEANGVPFPPVALVLAIVFCLAGGISVLLGLWARVGALLLFVFLVLATYFFHDFWTLEGQAAQQQQIHFMKNLSMMGTMLLIMAVGAGPWSLDARRKTPTEAA